MDEYLMKYYPIPFGMTRRYYIDERGCALCASAALLYLLTGNKIIPPVLDYVINQKGCYNSKDEIIWRKIARYAGFKCKTWLYDGKKKAELKKLPVPCLVTVDGELVEGYQSHFVVAVAEIENDIKIFDPFDEDIKYLSFYPGKDRGEQVYSVIRMY